MFSSVCTEKARDVPCGPYVNIARHTVPSSFLLDCRYRPPLSLSLSLSLTLAPVRGEREAMYKAAKELARTVCSATLRADSSITGSERAHQLAALARQPLRGFPHLCGRRRRVLATEGARFANRAARKNSARRSCFSGSGDGLRLLRSLYYMYAFGLDERERERERERATHSPKHVCKDTNTYMLKYHGMELRCYTRSHSET